MKQIIGCRENLFDEGLFGMDDVPVSMDELRRPMETFSIFAHTTLNSKLVTHHFSMNNAFTRTYFYVLLAESLLFLISARIFDFYELYSRLTYHTDVLPAVLFTGSFAFICVLSLLVTTLFVRKAGQTPLRFSWINTVLFMLFGSFCLFMIWMASRCPLVEYLKYFYSDWLLLGFCSILAVVLTSGISYIIRQTKNLPGDELLPVNDAQPDNDYSSVSSSPASRRWYTTFMLLTLIMAFIYLLLGVVIFERGYSWREAYFTMMTVIIINLVSGTFIALLSHYGSQLIEKNKSLAFLVNIFITIVFVIPHMWGIYVVLSSMEYIPMSQHTEKNWFSYPLDIGDLPVSDTGVVVVEDGSQEIYEDDSESEDTDPDIEYNAALVDIFYSKDYNPLWYNAEAPQDSILGALKSLRDKMDMSFLIYDMDISFLEETDPETWKNDSYYYADTSDDILFLKALRYISLHRNDIPLADMLRAYRPLLEAFITDEIYENNGYQKLITLLIYAYNDMERSDVYETRHSSPLYETIWNIMLAGSADDPDRYDRYAREIAQHARLDRNADEGSEMFYLDDDLGAPYVVWAYSFWSRRWKEGNIDRAWEVIGVIEDIYFKHE